MQGYGPPAANWEIRAVNLVREGRTDSPCRVSRLLEPIDSLLGVLYLPK